MKWTIPLFFIFCAFGIYSKTLAQDLNDQSDLLFNLADPEKNPEDFTDNLIQVYQQKVNINKATREDLQNLYLLNDFQINALLDHISESGSFLSIYELQAVEGFSPEIIRKITPFITVNNDRMVSKPLKQRIFSNQAQYVIFRTELIKETKKGYVLSPDGKSLYVGSPYKIAGRYRNSRFNDYSLNISFEKDPGEAFRYLPSRFYYGFDNYSFHVALFNQRKIKALCLGDYSIQMGQGLLAGSGFTLGKGAEAISTIRRNYTGIKPFSSFAEIGFYRGAALCIVLHPQWELSIFASRKRVDASFADTSLGSFKSIMGTGYHRTANELATRKTVVEFDEGAQLSYFSRRKNLRISANSLFSQFNKNYVPEKDSYQLFTTKFNNRAAFSSDYTLQYRNLNFFGEAALSDGSFAVVQGIIASLSQNIDFSLHYRNFSEGFFTINGNAFSEGSTANNERGFYQGIRIKPNRKIELAAYLDVFSFPWLKYRVNKPSHGSEYLVKGSYLISRKINLYCQFKQETKELNNSGTAAPIYSVENITKRNLTAGYHAKGSEIVSTSARIIFSDVHFANTRTSGFTLLQDLTFDFRRWEISGRFALFDLEDYDNRHYVYEKDLLYSFYLPAYYGKGIRTYLLGKVSLHKNIDLWLKIARTNYADRDKISSGNEEIQGRQKTEFKLQLRWKMSS